MDGTIVHEKRVKVEFVTIERTGVKTNGKLQEYIGYILD